MKNKLRMILLGLGIIIGSVAGVSSVLAEEIISSMTVSEPTQKMILAPGETYSGSIKISNSNDNKNDLIYSASIGSFSQTGDENSKDDYAIVDHIERSNYNQIMDWITLSKTSGVVAPNTTDILMYTITVPEDAPAGGQYATIIVRDDTNNNEGGDGNIAVQNIIQFASIIYAKVAGETTEVGSVLENSVPVISFGSPLMASSMVKNEGNVHTDAEYILQVFPLFSNKEVYSNEEKPMTSLILPESERYNSQTWEEAPMVGIFRVKQTVRIFNDVSTVEKIVIICPLWLIFIIILVIMAIITWLFKRNKNRKKS